MGEHIGGGAMNKVEMQVHWAVCKACGASVDAKNCKAWAYGHAKRHNHVVDYCIRVRLTPAPDNVVALDKAEQQAMAKAARESVRDEEAIQRQIDLEDGRQDYASVLADIGLLGPWQGKTTREIGKTLDHLWTGKSSRISRTIAKAMRDSGYRMKQKSIRGYPTWIWVRR